MTTIRELRPEEVQALYAFAGAEGRTWKRTLAEVYWFNARVWDGGQPNDGALLHALRNDPPWGHEGLDAITFAKLEKLAIGHPSNSDLLSCDDGLPMQPGDKCADPDCTNHA